MGRAQQAQVRQQGNTLLGQESGFANQNASNAQGDYNFLMPALTNLYNNPGYTAEQQSAITNATEGGIGAGFGASEQAATNRAARTNNAAGLTSTQDELARERMRTSADAASQNQTNFANAARGDQQRALQAMQGLFGTSLSGASSGFGNANSTLGILNDSANQKNAFTNSLLGALGKSLGTFGFASGPSGNSYGFGG